MLIKVCGMQKFDQASAIEMLADYVGFIFYENSKRFVDVTPVIENAKKVGVFVDASIEEVNRCIASHSLDAVQFHGQESAEMCASVRQEVQVIKAFGIDDAFNFEVLESYSEHVDYFLFDTKTQLHGGSGEQYDWSILSNYQGSTPFFLSGGIRPESIQALSQFSHVQFAGIDLNSRFEIAPGDKDVKALKQFIEQLNIRS